MNNGGKGTISGSNKTNTASVTIKNCEDLISEYQRENKEIPFEITNDLDKNEFLSVHLICNYTSDKDCFFTWSRLKIHLDTLLHKDEEGNCKPIVYDMFPKKVLGGPILKDEEQESSGDFNLFLLHSIGVGANEKSIEKKHYQEFLTHIIGTGKNENEINWIMHRTPQKKIEGTKDLEFKIKYPKNSKVVGRFRIDAEVYEPKKFRRGTTKEDKIVEFEYDFFNNEVKT